MNRDTKNCLDMNPVCNHASNGVFVFILEGADKRTGAMMHC